MNDVNEHARFIGDLRLRVGSACVKTSLVDALPNSGEANHFQKTCVCASCPVVLNVFPHPPLQTLSFPPPHHKSQTRYVHAIINITKKYASWQNNKFMKQAILQ